MKFSIRFWIGALKVGLLSALTVGAIAAAEPSVSADGKAIVISSTAAREAARFRLEPEYPAAARQFRLSGDVQAEVTIGLDGKVESVAVSKGNAILNSAVSSAVKKWTFAPFSVDGRPTRAKSTLTFTFKL